MNKEKRKKRIEEILGLIEWGCNHLIDEGRDQPDPYITILSALQDVQNLHNPMSTLEIRYAFITDEMRRKVAKCNG